MKDRDADLLIDEEEEEEEERGESRKETTEGLTGSGFYRQPENGRETQQMEVMRSRALGEPPLQGGVFRTSHRQPLRV